MKTYLYQSRKNGALAGDEAVIVLPDIYGQMQYSKQTVEDFAVAFGKPVFLLDYFFLSTGQTNCFTEKDKAKAYTLMQSFDAEGFTTFFQKVLEKIKQKRPTLKKFIVIGFCFGGRLAYIAGGEIEVSKIVSFYGAGAHTPNYVFGKTPIEYLIAKRVGATEVSVNAFFGTQDQTISENDRQKTRSDLVQAGLLYEGHEYEAGHAYFQAGRKNYDALASEASLEVLRKALN